MTELMNVTNRMAEIETINNKYNKLTKHGTNPSGEELEIKILLLEWDKLKALRTELKTALLVDKNILITSTNLIDLLKEGAHLKLRKVFVTFKPDYIKEFNCFSPNIIQSFKTSRKEIFDIISEGFEVIRLTKNENVQSIKWL